MHHSPEMLGSRRQLGAQVVMNGSGDIIASLFLEQDTHYLPEAHRGTASQLCTSVTCSLLHPVLASFPATCHFSSSYWSWDCLPNKSLAVETSLEGLRQREPNRNQYFSHPPGLYLLFHQLKLTSSFPPGTRKGHTNLQIWPYNKWNSTGLKAALFKTLNPVWRVFPGSALFSHMPSRLGQLSSWGPY